MSDHLDLALTHHYPPTGLNEDVPLYAGEFTLDSASEPATGTVTWKWGKNGRVQVNGERDLKFADPIADFLDGLERNSSSIWVEQDSIELDLPEGHIPRPPEKIPGTARESGSTVTLSGKHTFGTTVEQQLGNPTRLDRVTFLIPNGWRAHDAKPVREVADSVDKGDAVRSARTATSGDGWSVIFDLVPQMVSDLAWQDLRDRGGMQFTHVGELRRVDGSIFSGAEAFDLLDRVRVALNIALGRRVSCTLPVGYLDGAPVWTRWRTAPIDRFGNSSDWLDTTIAATQIGQFVGLVLDATASSGTRAALRSATNYYTAAKSATVDLTVALPVSGLQALSFFTFVSEQRISKGKWAELNTESQARNLLALAKIDLSIPSHLEHLESARLKLLAARQDCDALTTVVKMRNIVTHPTDKLPYETCNPYEWAEGGMVACYWLCLALLMTVGYDGQISARLEKEGGFLGNVKSPPWAASRHRD